MHRLLPALAAFAIALPAQDKPNDKPQDQPGVKAFLPSEHRNVAFVDLAKMRDNGVWDELEVSVLKMMFSMIEKESGFRLRDVDRVTLVSQAGEGELANARRDMRVVVIEGNKPLGVAASVAQNWDVETFGGQQVRSRGDELFVQPRPEVQVTGQAEIVRPALEGKPHSGQPCADILSLLSARKDRLVYYVFDVTNPILRKEVLGKLFDGVEWPEGDAPTFLCVQLLATGDPDDLHIGFEAVIRHTQDGPGLAVSQTAVSALLDRWRKEPKMQLAREVLQAAQARKDRGDLVVSADLGRARHAVGQLAMLLLPTIMPHEVVVEAVPVQPVPAPDPEPKKQ